MKPKIRIKTSNFGIKYLVHIDRKGFLRSVAVVDWVEKGMQSRMLKSFYEKVSAAHKRDMYEIENKIPIKTTRYLKNLHNYQKIDK